MAAGTLSGYRLHLVITMDNRLAKLEQDASMATLITILKDIHTNSGEMLGMFKDMKKDLDEHISMENGAIVLVKQILSSIPNGNLYAHYLHHKIFVWAIGALATGVAGICATAAGKYIIGG